MSERTPIFSDEEILAAAREQGADLVAVQEALQQPKSPWNPSKKALARVKDPIPVPTCCRYCNGTVRIVGHAVIYFGRTFGDWPWVYRCEACSARVGMHRFTNLPLGTLADKTLRDVRNRCKKPFDRIWEGGHMGRSQAYRWLGEHLGKSIADCHFGLFEAPECERAERLSLDYLATGDRKPAGGPTLAAAFQAARGQRVQ
jgi:hypothetical protein